MLLRVILIALYALKIEAYNRIDQTMESGEFLKKGMKFPEFGTHGKSRFSVQKRKEPDESLTSTTVEKKYSNAASDKQTRFTLVRTSKMTAASPSANDLENNSNENDNKKYPVKDNSAKRYKIVKEIIAETLQLNDDEDAGIEVEDPSKSEEAAKNGKEYPQFDHSGKSKYVKKERKIPGTDIEPRESIELDISLSNRDRVKQYPYFDIGKSKYAPANKKRNPIEVYDSGEIEVGVSSASEITGEEMKHSKLKNDVNSNQSRFKLIRKREESMEKNNLIKGKESEMNTTSESEFKWYPQRPQPQYSALKYEYEDSPLGQKSILRSDVGGLPTFSAVMYIFGYF